MNQTAPRRNRGSLKRIPVALLLFLAGSAHAVTTFSQSAISDCSVEPVTMISRSEVVHGSPAYYRARVVATHYAKDDIWRKIDTVDSRWSGIRATVSHDHDFPGFFRLFQGADDLRIKATHFYQRCRWGFWSEWKEDATDQIGCGEDEA